jgi:membrane associated rhomboid family serine protease
MAADGLNERDPRRKRVGFSLWILFAIIVGVFAAGGAVLGPFLMMLVSDPRHSLAYDLFSGAAFGAALAGLLAGVPFALIVVGIVWSIRQLRRN